ncbi:MAG: N-acetyltransferase [Gemmatales bacterium]|nr:MAG: N-acetyltransferase [Gemmatales bacterium]
MSETHFERYRMEIELHNAPRVPRLPPAYFWVPWQEGLQELHADVKFRSFHAEIDASVFHRLSTREGCLSLMHDISSRQGFLPEATWMVACAEGCCGTVQGICVRPGVGAIQNLGVVPEHRDRGLGTALLLRALEGFRRRGLVVAFLEVTAQNKDAVRLYQRLGFHYKKTIYKPVESAVAAGS